VERDFLGRGWVFPVSVAVDGDVALAAGPEDVREAVRLILETEPGERVMRPDFGGGLRRFVFAPLSTGTLALVRHQVEQALIRWEPRIDLDGVRVAPDSAEPGRLNIEIDYRVRDTNTSYNLVYPFYLQEGSA
jgi:phage baseplate assembly protein W